MAQMTVRNLDDAAYQRLKERAKANNRSLEAEAREILSAAVKPSLAGFAQWSKEFREKIGSRYKGDSTAEIRADRDR
jgi:hypothetical protein